ncbi:MAG: extracellular solute-binding protein [Phenylobacterium sp.]|nr:extracellular solute-binding protein [Phenylobacterium sp.]
MTPRITLFATLAFGLTLAACDRAAETPQAKGEGGTVNVYSARHYDADKALYTTFTERTGIQVNVVEGNAQQLVARMQSEGAASPADVFVTADAGALWRAQDAKLLQPLTTEALTAAVPANLRDPGGQWWGFQRRARVVAYDAAKVKPEEVDTYEELASPRFRGKLCVRSSDNVYNLSLTGALIEAWGPEKAGEWAKGIVANMARQPEGGDRDQIRAVGAGVCEIALTNSYYYIRMASGDDAGDKAVTDKVKLAFPSLDGQGAHVNISGVGLAANAKNRDAAVRLIEFLVSPEAQTARSAANGEFTLSPGVPTPAPTAAWADFKAHPMPVSAYGPRQAEAQALMSAAGWR